MLNWIIEASLKHRKLVLILALVACAAGAFSVTRLSIDAFPDVTDVMVQVNTTAPALNPLEIEQQIRRGCRFRKPSIGKPSFAIAPGFRFCTNTSAFASKAANSALSSGLARSSTTDSLPRLSQTKFALSPWT